MTREELCEGLKETAAEIFELPRQDITMDLKAGMIEPWDSFGHLQLFMAIEQKWGIKFTTEEIIKLSSMEAIASNMYDKVGS